MHERTRLRNRIPHCRDSAPHPMTEPAVTVREIDQEEWEAHLSELGLIAPGMWERCWLWEYEPMRSTLLRPGPIEIPPPLRFVGR